MMSVYVFSKQIRAKAAKTPALVEKNPLVEFQYPSSKHPSLPFTQRQVRLIGANTVHMIGLEILPSENGRKPRHQFKRFRRDKMLYFKLKEFNSAAVAI